jgi:fibronectin type 3 domain-containing protein
MKNLKKVFALTALFALVLAACKQPAGDDPKQEEKTTITIRNECFSDLIDVKWSETLFADKDNTLSISSAVTKTVEAGEAYIYFSRKSNPVVARTTELFTIEKGQQLTFRFFDNTLIVEASNPDNTGSLKDLISRLLTPSKPVLTAHNGTIEAVWEPVEGAASYRVYVSETETPPEEANKTVTETAATITGLTNEKTYHVWIQAVSARSESELSPAAQKTLTLGVPAAPTLTPGNGSISASWETVDMATSYKVYIGTTSTPPEEADKTLTETTTVFTGLSNDTPYYVWVQAVNAGGGGVLSERAQLALTLAAPQNVSLTPGNGKITVQWDAVDGASSYKVYYSVGTTPPAEAAQTVTGTSVTLEGLSNGATYNVWVQAVNNGGGGVLSERAQLALTLAAPQNVSLTPGNGSLTASWEAVTLADSYKVYYGTTSTRPQEAEQTVTGTSVTIESLSNGATYYVWVQAANMGGGGVLSERAQLALTLAAPQNVSLTPGNGKITVQWEAVNGASSYKVYYSVSTTQPAEAAQTVTGTSVTIEGSSNGTTYYVWVQAANMGGGGTVSERAQLTLTLDAPQSITLSAGDGRLTASWEAVTLADSYKVYVSDTTTRPADATQTATGTSAVVSGLSNNPTYHVWVQAVNAGGDGTCSDRVQVFLPVHFTVANSGDLANAIASINAAGEGEYAITLASSITTGPITFDENDSKTITVKANGTRSLTNSGGAALVTVPGSITLILDQNITLDGNSQSYPVVNVLSGGTFVMNEGSTVMGARGSGVVSRGTFIMNGGNISSNITNTNYARSGGVYIAGGTFTMSGGAISDNSVMSSTAYSYGGGVYIESGTFTMSGGAISRNSTWSTSSSYSYSYGGGVYIASGTFTMSGGTISGNSGSYSSNSYSYGGGVYVEGGIFTKTGGTIDNTNTAKTGKVAYVKSGSKKRDGAAGPGVNMNSNTAGSAGGWETF